MVCMGDGANPGEGGDPGESANPGEGVDSGIASDEARLAALATGLADGIQRVLGPWVVRNVERIMEAWQGTCPEEIQQAAAAAAVRATDEVMPAVRALLATDVDEQRGNPLALLRPAVRYPTGVLRAAGVPGVVRDAEAERQFPDDDYDLTPASFAEIDRSLHEPGMAWGAAKAHVVLQRRRAEGRRI
jgi:hypothetical protein